MVWPRKGRDYGGVVITPLLALLLGALYLVLRRSDRRRLFNGVVLVAALWLAVMWLGGLLARSVPGFEYVSWAILLALPVGICALGSALIANGVTMWKLEGRSLGNMLSLIVGVLFFALPALVILLVVSLTPWGVGLGVLVFFVSSYVGVVFVIFLAYAFAYARMPMRFTPDALVVLGSRIIDGRVPPLLAARLDKAIEVYQQTEPKPLVIPSGGQGPDEALPEGEAMAAYLVEHGVPATDIAVEDRAETTQQNLLYGRAIQESHGRRGPLLAVTNDYHVLRAALLTRKLGFDAEVVGSRTARYYRPSAFLREFVAVLREHKVLNALACVPFLALSAFLWWAAATHGGWSA